VVDVTCRGRSYPLLRYLVYSHGGGVVLLQDVLQVRGQAFILQLRPHTPPPTLMTPLSSHGPYLVYGHGGGVVLLQDVLQVRGQAFILQLRLTLLLVLSTKR
jgi:hypothetical protein